MKFNLPLHTNTTKSKTKKGKFILNLNNYRNCHFTRLNAVKIAYKNDIKGFFPAGLKYKKVKLIYTLYRATERLCDVSNVCSIIDKFACDVLVSLDIIEDDNFNIVKEVVYKFGGIDKSNPRCELEILEID